MNSVEFYDKLEKEKYQTNVINHPRDIPYRIIKIVKNSIKRTKQIFEVDQIQMYITSLKRMES